MHKLLILGSLDEFVGLIELAKSRGIYTIVCDGYEGTIGKLHGDKSYDIPVGNIDEIVEMCGKEGVDGIITSFSDFLFECMVKIAEKAGLKCYFDSRHLPCYRDKSVMKDMLTKLGIPTPAYVYVDQDFEESQLFHLGFPVVAKPLDKYGSRGVRVLDSPGEVKEQFPEICKESQLKKILVEEYHNGYEFNMMTWVLDGRVQVISIADREKTSVGKGKIPISTRNVYPSRWMDEVYGEAKEILQKTADYTGQTQGPLSMQFFWSRESGVKVCEVAGRFFGYEHELTELAGGLSTEELLLDYVYTPEAIKAAFRNYTPWFHKISAVLYFHGKTGMVVADQDKARKIQEKKNVEMSQIFYKEGETVESHGPNPYVARYYIVTEDRAAADHLTEEIFREISVTDVRGEELLYRNQLPQQG